MSDNIEIKRERIRTMRAAYFHAFSNTPEEDAWTLAQDWAEKKGLLKKDSTNKIFGRNCYPTENPEPHGYGFFLTITPDIQVEKEISVRMIPGGLYLVAKCEGLEQISIGWPKLWELVKEGKDKFIGETRGEHGFELGFEEVVNWYSAFVNKSEEKIIFNLMIQLWEE